MNSPQLLRGSDPTAPGPHGDEKRGAFGAVLTRVLGPLYYWLDLYDAGRRPNHSKIKTTGALLVALGITIGVAKHAFSHPDLEADELLAIFGFVVLILFASYGLAGLTIWAHTRGGGSVDAMASTAKAAIAARRAATGNDHEPSP